MCLKCWLQKFILDMSFDMISWYVDFRSWNDVGDALWYASMSSGLIRNLIWYLAWEIITIISFLTWHLICSWYDYWCVFDMTVWYDVEMRFGIGFDKCWNVNWYVARKRVMHIQKTFQELQILRNPKLLICSWNVTKFC